MLLLGYLNKNKNRCCGSNTFHSTCFCYDEKENIAPVRVHLTIGYNNTLKIHIVVLKRTNNKNE